MWPDRVSNPRPPAQESDELSTAQRGPATKIVIAENLKVYKTPDKVEFWDVSS